MQDPSPVSLSHPSPAFNPAMWFPAPGLSHQQWPGVQIANVTTSQPFSLTHPGGQDHPTLIVPQSQESPQDMPPVRRNAPDPSMAPVSPPPTRERFNYTPYQIELLNAIYSRIRYPNTMQKQLVAKRVGITRDQVKIWFQNRRRKDVIGKTNPRSDGSSARLTMVPTSVFNSILSELLQYEKEVKGRKARHNLNKTLDQKREAALARVGARDFSSLPPSPGTSSSEASRSPISSHDEYRMDPDGYVPNGMIHATPPSLHILPNLPTPPSSQSPVISHSQGFHFPHGTLQPLVVSRCVTSPHENEHAAAESGCNPISTPQITVVSVREEFGMEPAVSPNDDSSSLSSVQQRKDSSYPCIETISDDSLSRDSHIGAQQDETGVAPNRVVPLPPGVSSLVCVSQIASESDSDDSRPSPDPSPPAPSVPTKLPSSSDTDRQEPPPNKVAPPSEPLKFDLGLKPVSPIEPLTVHIPSSKLNGGKCGEEDTPAQPGEGLLVPQPLSSHPYQLPLQPQPFYPLHSHSSLSRGGHDDSNPYPGSMSHTDPHQPTAQYAHDMASQYRDFFSNPYAAASLPPSSSVATPVSGSGDTKPVMERMFPFPLMAEPSMMFSSMSAFPGGELYGNPTPPPAHAHSFKDSYQPWALAAYGNPYYSQELAPPAQPQQHIL